jgi:hypothetical protein
MIELHLTTAEAEELLLLLDQALGDLSFEIADTDNPEVRDGLKERRRGLTPSGAR